MEDARAAARVGGDFVGGGRAVLLSDIMVQALFGLIFGLIEERREWFVVLELR
jgi:hypothetical protein